MSAQDTTAWIDLVSPSHPFFFNSLADELSDVERTTTVREKTETVDLAGQVGFDYSVLGRDFDNTLLRKLGIPLRTLQLAARAPSADVSLSSRNAMCVLASKVRGIPSIHFTDNDITAYVDGLHFEKLYNALEAQATYNVVPSAFDTNELTRWGANEDQILTYDGYKEDIYIAGFEPDPDFTNKLPFDDFIVVRPEALDAAYVDVEESIVPELLERLFQAGFNVVYLPRGRGDEEYAESYGRGQIYTPQTALNGLQLAWHCQCMLTGSGTMAREAACMEKPAVSFFPNKMLSVDQELVEDGKIFYSRDPKSIVEYIESLTDKDALPDRSASRAVRRVVVDMITNITNEESAEVTNRVNSL
ncbi:DUF354 domain-containing protein [Salinigranum halophilum]|uniref:DUF354 domain-containing protein n=1 Tax=Salinigranum halophilum TaxID=2565931 RepID=UPI0010A92DDE|nr:DUF354 domain-containing protein [Salinigranum halophilum]